MPCKLCASLNEWADLGADEALTRDAPTSVSKPAGGIRFFMEHMGRTIIGDPADHIRGWFSAAATERLLSLSTQGLVARSEESGEQFWALELSEWRALSVPDSMGIPDQSRPWRLLHLAIEN